jgi:type III secretion protein V
MILAGVFAAAGYWTHRRRAAAASTQTRTEAAPKLKSEPGQAAVPQPAAGTDVANTPTRYRIAVCLGPELGKRVPPDHFDRETERVRQSLAADLGVESPPVGLRLDERLEPHHFKIEFDGVPVLDADIPADSFLVEVDAVDLELLAVPYAEGPRINKRTAMWVEQQHQAALAAAGIECLTETQVLAKWLSQMLRRYATQFIGIQETREILVRADKDYPELMKEINKITTLQKIAELLRRLLDENVPVSNMRLILEALVEWGPREQDTVLLVERVRIALRRQICFRCADRNRVIVAYMLERAAEDTLRSSIRSTPVGAVLSIPDTAARAIVERIKAAIAATSDTLPVVLTSMDVRRHVRSLLSYNNLDVSVLSYQEMAPEFSVQPLAVEAPHRGTAGVAAEAAE